MSSIFNLILYIGLHSINAMDSSIDTVQRVDFGTLPEDKDLRLTNYDDELKWERHPGVKESFVYIRGVNGIPVISKKDLQQQLDEMEPGTYVNLEFHGAVVEQHWEMLQLWQRETEDEQVSAYLKEEIAFRYLKEVDNMERFGEISIPRRYGCKGWLDADEMIIYKQELQRRYPHREELYEDIHTAVPDVDFQVNLLANQRLVEISQQIAESNADVSLIDWAYGFRTAVATGLPCECTLILLRLMCDVSGDPEFDISGSEVARQVNWLMEQGADLNFRPSPRSPSALMLIVSVDLKLGTRELSAIVLDHLQMSEDGGLRVLQDAVLDSHHCAHRAVTVWLLQMFGNALSAIYPDIGILLQTDQGSYDRENFLRLIDENGVHILGLVKTVKDFLAGFFQRLSRFNAYYKLFSTTIGDSFDFQSLAFFQEMLLPEGDILTLVYFGLKIRVDRMARAVETGEHPSEPTEEEANFLQYCHNSDVQEKMSLQSTMPVRFSRNEKYVEEILFFLRETIALQYVDELVDPLLFFRISPTRRARGRRAPGYLDPLEMEKWEAELCENNLFEHFRSTIPRFEAILHAALEGKPPSDLRDEYGSRLLYYWAHDFRTAQQNFSEHTFELLSSMHADGPYDMDRISSLVLAGADLNFRPTPASPSAIILMTIADLEQERRSHERRLTAKAERIISDQFGFEVKGIVGPWDGTSGGEDGAAVEDHPWKSIILNHAHENRYGNLHLLQKALIDSTSCASSSVTLRLLELFLKHLEMIYELRGISKKVDFVQILSDSRSFSWMTTLKAFSDDFFVRLSQFNVDFHDHCFDQSLNFERFQAFQAARVKDKVSYELMRTYYYFKLKVDDLQRASEQRKREIEPSVERQKFLQWCEENPSSEYHKGGYVVYTYLNSVENLMITRAEQQITTPHSDGHSTDSSKAGDQVGVQSDEQIDGFEDEEVESDNSTSCDDLPELESVGDPDNASTPDETDSDSGKTMEQLRAEYYTRFYHRCTSADAQLHAEITEFLFQEIACEYLESIIDPQDFGAISLPRVSGADGRLSHDERIRWLDELYSKYPDRTPYVDKELEECRAQVELVLNGKYRGRPNIEDRMFLLIDWAIQFRDARKDFSEHTLDLLKVTYEAILSEAIETSHKERIIWALEHGADWTFRPTPLSHSAVMLLVGFELNEGGTFFTSLMLRQHSVEWHMNNRDYSLRRSILDSIHCTPTGLTFRLFELFLIGLDKNFSVVNKVLQTAHAMYESPWFEVFLDNHREVEILKEFSDEFFQRLIKFNGDFQFFFKHFKKGAPIGNPSDNFFNLDYDSWKKAKHTDQLEFLPCKLFRYYRNFKFKVDELQRRVNDLRGIKPSPESALQAQDSGTNVQYGVDGHHTERASLHSEQDIAPSDVDLNQVPQNVGAILENLLDEVLHQARLTQQNNMNSEGTYTQTHKISTIADHLPDNTQPPGAKTSKAQSKQPPQNAPAPLDLEEVQWNFTKRMDEIGGAHCKTMFETIQSRGMRMTPETMVNELLKLLPRGKQQELRSAYDEFQSLRRRAVEQPQQSASTTEEDEMLRVLSENEHNPDAVVRSSFPSGLRRNAAPKTKPVYEAVTIRAFLSNGKVLCERADGSFVEIHDIQPLSYEDEESPFDTSFLQDVDIPQPGNVIDHVAQSDVGACVCHDGFYGTHCEKSAGTNSSNHAVVWIVLSICVAVVALVVILLVLRLRRHGVDDKKISADARRTFVEFLVKQDMLRHAKFQEEQTALFEEAGLPPPDFSPRALEHASPTSYVLNNRYLPPLRGLVHDGHILRKETDVERISRVPVVKRRNSFGGFKRGYFTIPTIHHGVPEVVENATIFVPTKENMHTLNSKIVQEHEVRRSGSRLRSRSVGNLLAAHGEY